jgi:ABC-2 type transport system ATP-binding protein
MSMTETGSLDEGIAVLSSVVTDRERGKKVISVKNLVKNYGRFTAVAAVSFHVYAGEVFALLGPNGAGKTTIVEILEMTKPPTKGYISILGNDVMTGIAMGNVFMGADRDDADIKEKIGVLPQSFNAFDLLTVRENLDYFARMYAKHMDIDRLIDEMGLTDRRNTRFKNLSGGMKQRVGVAIALVNDPEIVFLDEPSAGLDPRARRDLWDIILGLKARGKTVFLTTHYMDEAYHLADRICVIHRGSIVAEGSPDDLIARYGGGNTLTFRECGDVAMDEMLISIPHSRASGNDVLVKLPDGDCLGRISEIISIARVCRCTCAEVYVERSTLDDVFLNLTGEKLTGRDL